MQIQRGRHLGARQRLERGLSRDQELLLALHRVLSDPPQRYPPVVEVSQEAFARGIAPSAAARRSDLIPSRIKAGSISSTVNTPAIASCSRITTSGTTYEDLDGALPSNAGYGRSRRRLRARTSSMSVRDTPRAFAIEAKRP